MRKWFYTLNEHVLLSSQYLPTKNVRLIYPYSVSLNFSILNKDEDCLFNNLAVLDDYITIFVRNNIILLLFFNILCLFIYFQFSENQTIGIDDKKSFLTMILRHYEDISLSLPDDFLFESWKFLFNPQNADICISKELLQLSSYSTLDKCFCFLKFETVRFELQNQMYVDFKLFIYFL